MLKLIFYTILLSLLSSQTHLQAAASSLGPLSDYIQPIDDGTWRVVDDGTSAYLENTQAQGAITYYYVDANKNVQGNRTISIDIAFGQSTELSMAGLLYSYTDKPKSYYMLTVRGDSSINMHQMIDGNLEELLVVPMDDLSADKTTLTIQENGNSVTVSINGQTLDTYTDEQFGRGAVGIVASDIGQYKFSHFSITTEQRKSEEKAALSGGNIMPDAKTATPVDNKVVTIEPKTAAPTTNNTSSVTEPIKYFSDPDSRFKGMISGYTPYPASWKQQLGHKEFYYDGPNGIKVSNTFGQIYQFANNQDGLEMLQMEGAKNTPPYSIQKIVDELFMPTARQSKRELVKTYPLEEYAQTRKDFLARLFKSVPVRESVTAYALEWKDDQGLSYITVLSVVVSEAFPISSWFVQGQYLVAENDYFESARDAFLYGLVHTEVNPKWLETVNQRDAQIAGRSWAAHESRMNAIKARGEASKSIADIYSEISDISHAGFLERSNIQSKGHSASIRATNETTLIANQNTGERYEVEGNNNYHWVNSNGVHIATDNSLFDPRTDEQLKMFDWSQFQAEQ